MLPQPTEPPGGEGVQQDGTTQNDTTSGDKKEVGWQLYIYA